MAKRLLCVLAAVLAAGANWAWSGDEAASRPTGRIFDPDSYLAHIKYLAGDELEGRQPGTPGIEAAAEYIAKQFKNAELKPAGDDGTYFQTFEVRRGKKIDEANAALRVEGVDAKWDVRKDWIPLPFSSLEDAEGPLAFAGYGIKAEAYEYNDYADFDATGKLLLVFRYEPRAEDPAAEFGGQTPSRHSLFRRKAELAARQGAKAILIVNPPLHHGAADELFAFDEQLSEQTFDLPIIQVTRAVAERMLKEAGRENLATLQERLDRARKTQSVDLDLKVELQAGVKHNLLATRNVLGLLPGDGSTEETIVVGAHYDHLGKVGGQWGGKDNTPQIHNGADDNASGTAGVIELARLLARERGLRRNVLLMTFSAEEMGLLGSHYFVAHPTIPLKDIRVMVNFDMIGRLGAEQFTVYGVQSGKEFSDLVTRAAENVGLPFRSSVGALFGASDHASFYARDIPVLFPFTGIHKQYHTPDDDWELIDAQGATNVLTMFHEIVRELANLADGPRFQPRPTESEPEEPPIKPAAEHDKDVRQKEDRESTGGEADSHSKPRVRLGIVPDYAGAGSAGVIATSVVEGGPAKAAGVQDGDRIIKIGDHRIEDIYAYMAALREVKPGSVLELVVVRQEQEITIQVKIPEPPRRAGSE